MSGLDYMLNDLAYINLREKCNDGSLICLSNRDSPALISHFISKVLADFPDCNTVHIGGLTDDEYTLSCSCSNCKVLLQEISKDDIICEYLQKIVVKIAKARPQISFIVEESSHYSNNSLYKITKNIIYSTKGENISGKYKTININSLPIACYCDPLYCLNKISSAIKEAILYKAHGAIIHCPFKLQASYVTSSLPASYIFPLYLTINAIQSDDSECMHVYQALNNANILGNFVRRYISKHIAKQSQTR
jgi:hypothetical protein